MPTVPVTARVSPYVRARLEERAAERDTTLAAVVASTLTAAVDDDAPGPRTDGPLVAAVRRVLEETDPEDPRAGVNRELCLLLARTVERKESGFLAAIGPLQRALSAAAPDRVSRTLNRMLDDLAA
ncbi:hypothetical protein [Streptomyces antibioticus]|uniref:hypothetical protein n=1 Tax=Streptomyces antibioticus TaxID=1890 RepID=UPI003D748709